MFVINYISITILHNFFLKDIANVFQMTTVSMGASVMSAVVALGALAYALTLEAKILTNDARSSSTCSAVSFLSYLLVYTVDTFFRQIKSFRRFPLAFGFGLQTFYLINFS